MKISEETRGRDRDEQRTSEQALVFFVHTHTFPAASVDISPLGEGKERGQAKTWLNGETNA